MGEIMELKLKTLTPLWTGGVEPGKMDRIHETSIIGSLRWWYEAIVRGMGGDACDPSNTKCEGKKHCVVCELFGCTSWARKFRFQIIGIDGKSFIKKSETNDEYVFRFTPLRSIKDEEWALLDLTFQLIANYGAIGGKTVYKPTDEIKRESEKHHIDYGLIEIIQSDLSRYLSNKEKVENYMNNSCWKRIDHGDFAWVSTKNLWCVQGRYLARQDTDRSIFNKIIGRPEHKNQSSDNDNWLSGKKMESKKVFSFKIPPRTFGFVKEGVISFKEFKVKLKQVWPDFKEDEFLFGNEVINQFFVGKEKNS